MACIPAHASVFHAIADPTRRLILDALRDGERSVSDLLESLADATQRFTQSAFSQHLAVLKRAGLVESRRLGRAQLYSFRPEPLADVAVWIAGYDRFWTEKLDNLGRYLDANAAPPALTSRTKPRAARSHPAPHTR